MKTLILQNNFLSIIKSGRLSIITFFVIFGIFFITKGELGFIPYLILVLLILDFPAWYIFITYFFKTKGNEISIDDNKLVIMDRHGNEESYNMSEINNIEFYKSKSEAALHPSMNYSYIKIYLKNDKHIYITCLMANNLVTVLEKLNKKYKVRYGLAFLK